MEVVNDKGYVLILVIIISGLIFTLGLGTLGISHTNYNMKKVNSISKQNFYIAESASEEAKLILDEYIQETINHANMEIYKHEEILKLKGEGLEIDYFLKKGRYDLFEQIYIENMKNIGPRLNCIRNYNLKKQEGYDFEVETSIEELKLDEGYKFLVTITSSYENRNIMERIVSKNLISIHKYGENKSSLELIEEIEWQSLNW